MELVKFAELEDRIKRVIEDHRELKTKNQQLEELIKIRGRELEEAEKRMSELTGERDAIRTKVDSLLGLLQDIAVPE